MTAHRALPLSIVEARNREQRTAWTGCTQTCRQGRDCTCAPASAPAEMAVYDPSSDDRKPPMTGADAVALVVGVILSACFSAWVLCNFAEHLKAAMGLS